MDLDHAIIVDVEPTTEILEAEVTAAGQDHRPLLTTARNHLSKADTVTVAAIESGISILVVARGLLNRSTP